jgi:ribosome-associated protein
MIEVTPALSIDENEIRVDLIRSSGPGGQNVNKVATAVQLRFDVLNSSSLSDDVKERLIRIAGKRMTSEGVLVLDARRFRSQERNRLDAVQRLVILVQKALVKPKIRRPTRPSLAAKAARINEKKKRGEIKRIRHSNPGEWE